ncbi:hypothetical protein [Pontibacter qinzhouensis]|uniref:hypothetical protein n=1 Tax=Pontibacter qinzhouensis TaxID=2603253 RepID=UPI00165084D1|nr:hypothetical protein [Pontibacter qinzhouensis]
MPNPTMEVQVESEWVSLYELIQLDEVMNNAQFKTYVFSSIKAYQQEAGFS